MCFFLASLKTKNYKKKILQISRITKVVKGGKKMTIRALIAIGDQKQLIGIGIGYGQDVSLAIQKAIIQGKNKLVIVPITKTWSIPHLIDVSIGASHIIFRPAFLGTGIIASSSIKKILELSGLKNIFVKQLGSNNILNNAKATLLALVNLSQKIELKKLQLKKYYFFYKYKMKYNNSKNFLV